MQKLTFVGIATLVALLVAFASTAMAGVSKGPGPGLLGPPVPAPQSSTPPQPGPNSGPSLIGPPVKPPTKLTAPVVKHSLPGKPSLSSAGVRVPPF